MSTEHSKNPTGWVFISGDDWNHKTPEGLITILLDGHQELVIYCQTLEKRIAHLEKLMGKKDQAVQLLRKEK